MLNDFTGADKIYIACGYTDLRKGIDGLARLVQQQFALDPFANTLFLFCGRRRDRIKGLYWEKDGFILLYKRLEQGVYQWPRSESEVKALTPQQYRWLMEGLRIEQKTAIRKGKPRDLFWQKCSENCIYCRGSCGAHLPAYPVCRSTTEGKRGAEAETGTHE